MLAGAREIEWTALKRAATPKLVTSGEAPDFNREGVTVWRRGAGAVAAGEAAARARVRAGSVSGVAAAGMRCSRPRISRRSVSCTGAAGRRRRPRSSRERRARFRRQLGAVSEAVTLLVPRRDAAGKRSVAVREPGVHAPAVRRAGGGGRAGASSSMRRRVGRQARHVALAAPAAPQPPRALVVEDLEFGRDLLDAAGGRGGQAEAGVPEQSRDADGVGARVAVASGSRRSRSPGRRSRPNPLLLGTLAHESVRGPVCAGCAAAGAGGDSGAGGGAARGGADAPWRRSCARRSGRWSGGTSPHSRPRRRSRGGTRSRSSARRWWRARRGSRASGAGIAVHGQTDLILGLPGDRLLVVDYKRSSSRKRLTQMQKGFDSQASLYRAMIASGGPKDPRRSELAARLKAAERDRRRVLPAERPGGAVGHGAAWVPRRCRAGGSSTATSPGRR